MISKKLLSEVLDIEDIKEYECRDNEYHIVRHDLPLPQGNQHILINIYELAHKCKEWAYKHNYGLESKHSTSDGGKWVCLINEFNIKFHSAKHANTEPEAIFKACEWILEQKTTK